MSKIAPLRKIVSRGPVPCPVITTGGMMLLVFKTAELLECGHMQWVKKDLDGLLTHAKSRRCEACKAFAEFQSKKNQNPWIR